MIAYVKKVCEAITSVGMVEIRPRNPFPRQTMRDAWAADAERDAKPHARFARGRRKKGAYDDWRTIEPIDQETES
jgi:hypothetical protein